MKILYCIFPDGEYVVPEITLRVLEEKKFPVKWEIFKSRTERDFFLSQEREAGRVLTLKEVKEKI